VALGKNLTDVDPGDGLTKCRPNQRGEQLAEGVVVEECGSVFEEPRYKASMMIASTSYADIVGDLRNHFAGWRTPLQRLLSLRIYRRQDPITTQFLGSRDEAFRGCGKSREIRYSGGEVRIRYVVGTRCSPYKKVKLIVSTADLSVALNYGQATGSAQLLRFITEHTEVSTSGSSWR